MAHSSPSYRLLLGTRDMTPVVDARLISLQLTECRSDEADRLDLCLTDHDGRLQIPSRGAELSLSIGWAGTDLIDKGTFIVNEVEHSGAPDQVTIRARSAELGQSLRTRAERSYHGMTVGGIVRQIASRHGLQARVDDRLAGRAVEHIDQTSESDLAFLTRLAKLHDAVATVKRGRVLFLPILGTTSSSGEPMPVINLTRADGDQHRFHTSDRDAYSGVRAYWHDPKRAKRRGVLVGVSGNAKRLRETYANEADARTAAIAEWRRVQRGAATLELTLATGQPLLAPQSPVGVNGFKDVIDAIEWLAIKVHHAIGDGGFMTRVELENGSADAAEGGLIGDDQPTDSNS